MPVDVVTFRMRRIDDRLVKTSLPGQYVTVQVPMPDGVRQPRQYSLTRADDGEHRQFSVKRVRADGKPAGEVSTLLCDQVQTGDVLTMSLPFGDRGSCPVGATGISQCDPTARAFAGRLGVLYAGQTGGLGSGVPIAGDGSNINPSASRSCS